jgi:hypothetical protein
MASYVLTIVGYPASDSTGSFEWGIAGAKGQLLGTGRSTIAGSGHTAFLAVERQPITRCSPASRHFSLRTIREC